jgi:uncharacterized protein (TIGR02453 family)
MMASVAFAGFSPGLLEFLTELGRNNNREWFQAHYADYQTHLVEPARDFVTALGERLPGLGAELHAEPKVRGSIFAINRDVRFSKDKSPYKAQLDLWFWQGAGPSRERPGYFLRLTPEMLILGAGIHAFSDAALERYRAAVLDRELGGRLEHLARGLPGPVQGQTYKRVPVGFPADHPRAEWLRHGGLYAATEQGVSDVLFSSAFPEACVAQFERLAPLQQWLVDVLPE